jgi:hypothetical protein
MNVSAALYVFAAIVGAIVAVATGWQDQPMHAQQQRL